MTRFLMFLVFVSLFLPPAYAGGLEEGGRARVASVVDGDTVLLDDRRQVRLVGLQAPKLPLGRPGFEKWPLAGEAKRALEKLVLGKTVALGYGGQRTDRHGRALAHLFGDGGTWIQGEMLRLGMARVYTFADNRKLAGDMYALEGEARSGKRGIWGDPYYAVRATAETLNDLDTFQVVEGKVLDAAKVKGRVYLNFGADWRSDFTISISPRAGRLFKKSGFDALALEGRWVRVRGWIKKFNGPMIEATHPEQIELLDR